MRPQTRVAGAALTVAFALVAVPGLAASRAPGAPADLHADTFRLIEAPVAAREPAAAPTLDPGRRSDGALDASSTFVDPFGAPESGPSGRAAVRQPAPLGVIVRPTPTPPPTAPPPPPPAPRAPNPTEPEPPPPPPSSGAWNYDPDVSWYGPGFYGNRTACGQTLTTGLQGVAHRTLACGTKVQFRNPANGRTITVPVVDRGPYVAGRTWDLTGGACTALDHCYTGPLQWRYP